jgi:hypothetical protein
MNKKQLRTEALSKHYNNIANLYLLSTGEEITQDQAKKISSKLVKLERLATIETTAQNNGYYVEPSPLDWKTGKAEQMRVNEEESNKKIDLIIEQIQKLFKGKLTGLWVNYDSRGYALKVKGENLPLSQDWGNNYILSPEIN